MNIQELKQAIIAAIEFGDRQRKIGRTFYSIAAIRALEALRDSFDNDNDEIDLATVIAQVGYIFTHHPVTPGSATEATWGHLLKNVLPPDLNVISMSEAQWVTEIKETQQSAKTKETIVKRQGNNDVPVKAVSPTLASHDIQALADAVQAALAGYYKQKYSGKINPAIKALEALHLQMMGKVLTGKTIDKEAYVADIVKIFAVDHPVQAGTISNNASYNVWLKLLPQLGLGLNADTTPKVAHSRLVKTFSKTATTRAEFNYTTIKTAVNNSVLDVSAMPSNGLNKAIDSTTPLSNWFKGWSWSSFLGSSTSVPAPITVIQQEPVVAVTLQHVNQKIGLPDEANIWQVDTDFAAVLAAIGTAEDLNAITQYLDAGKLLENYLSWKDNPHAATFWSAMIAGLRTTTTAFIENDEAFQVALIAHWKVADSAQCLAHVKGWVINNERVLAPGIADALIQKWQNTSNTFAAQDDAFKLVLIQQWPANQQTALLKHADTWGNLTAAIQQALIAKCAATKVAFAAHDAAGQQTLIKNWPAASHATLIGYIDAQPTDAIKTALVQYWPAGNAGLMNKLKAWTTIPDAVYSLLPQRFVATPSAFASESDGFKIALIEQCPNADKDVLIAHTKTWPAPLAGVAEALLAKLQDKAKAFIHHGADFQAALVQGCSVSTQHILLTHIAQWTKPLDVKVYAALTANILCKTYFDKETLSAEQKIAYIQHWPVNQFAALKTRIDAWYPAAAAVVNAHPIPAESFKALIGCFKDQASVFTTQDAAFKVELVRHWPLNDLVTLVKHAHAWYSKSNGVIPENIQAALTAKLTDESPAAIAELFNAVAAAQNVVLTPVQQFLVNLFDAQKFLTQMKLTTYDVHRGEKAGRKSSAIFSDFDKITQTDRLAAFNDFNIATSELSKPLLEKVLACLTTASQSPGSPFLIAMQSSGQSTFGARKDAQLSDVVTALKQRTQTV